MHRTVVALLVGCVVAVASVSSRAGEPVAHKWDVEGTERTGLICAPESAKTTPAPLLFAFHGHGGTARNAARGMNYQALWPEAVVVYLQGLNTPGRLTDPEGKKPGWQSKAGDLGDRDLKLFDAVLKSVHEEFKIDDKRVYCTGHSNGGGFTYLLWGNRGDVFAAVAPSSAAPSGLEGFKTLKPKPVLHVAGKNDPLVKFEWQKATIDQLFRINGCDLNGKNAEGQYVTAYPSPGGTPVVTFIHDGGHAAPKEAWVEVVKFFKGQSKP